MNFIKKNGVIIFWILLLVHCATIYLKMDEYRMYTKAILIPFLFAFVYLNGIKRPFGKSKLYFQSALICCWIGDLLLMKSGNNSFFIAGLIAFLIAHVFFIFFFARVEPLKIEKCTEAVLAAILLIGLNGAFYKFLGGYFGAFRKPVLVYMAIISIMAIMAANVLSNKMRKAIAVSHFVPGAALFIFSDATLAANKFYFDEPFLDIIIMMSYGYAMVLFAEGFTKYIRG